MNIVTDPQLSDDLIHGPVKIWNNNNACVYWFKNTTTKGLCHVQICKNAVCEGILMGLFEVSHTEGKNNPSDIFTKEDKDINHFMQVQNSVMRDHPEEVMSQGESTTSDSQTALRTGGVKLGVLCLLPV